MCARSPREAFPYVRRGISAALRGDMLNHAALFALGSDEPTIYVRCTPESTYRSSVVILGVAASLTWLAVGLICLLA
jgi:hypothetical protein